MANISCTGWNDICGIAPDDADELKPGMAPVATMDPCDTTGSGISVDSGGVYPEMVCNELMDVCTPPPPPSCAGVVGYCWSERLRKGN